MKRQWSRTDKIPNPAQDIKRESNTNAKNSIKYETAQAESQGNSSFPADGHHAILDKADKM